MTYKTQIDLSKQSKLKKGSIAELEGTIKLGEDLYLTKYNNIIQSSNKIYLLKLSEDGKLIPITTEELNITSNNGGGNSNSGNTNSLALKFRGVWGDTSMLPYLMGDMVTHNGELYVLTVATLNQNTEPLKTMLAPWTTIATAGYKGDNGNDGNDGNDGIDGKDGKHYEYVFLATATLRIPNKPIEGTHFTSQEFQVDDFVPLLPNTWSDDEISVSEDLPYIWRMSRVKENGVWGNFSSPKLLGMPGGIGADGSKGDKGDTYIRRYAKNGSTTVPPTLQNNVLNPSNWDLTIPIVNVGEYLWMTEVLVSGNNELKGTWSTPIRQTPIDRGEDIETQSPSMIFRGDWDSANKYNANKYAVDVVIYNGKGYIARVDAGTTIPIGQSPDLDINGEFWNMFSEEADSIFTDFLFAYSGHIGNLNAETVKTGNDGEAMTVIGRLPKDSPIDPTSKEDIYSPHGIRQYYKDGKIAMYMGLVTNFSYKMEDNTDAVANGWALITFKNEEGSPPHSIQDNLHDKVTFIKDISEQWQEVKFVQVATVNYTEGQNYPTFDWGTYNNSTPFTYTAPQSDNSRLKIPASGEINKLPNTYYWYLSGSVVANNIYNGYHTTQQKATNNFIPNGWYCSQILYGLNSSIIYRGDPIDNSNIKTTLQNRGVDITRNDIFYTQVYLIINGKIIEQVTDIINPRRSN